MSLIIVFLQEAKLSPWWLTEAFDFSDGASITWKEPPPAKTVQAVGVISDHLSSRKLHEGTIENLSWQFNLTGLKLNKLVLSFNRTPFAQATPSGKVAQSRFRKQIGIHWIRNKTLITLIIQNATAGTFTCQVNAFAVEGIGFPRQFKSNVKVDVVGKLKVKSMNTDIYIY